jgi:hypothetical protein
VTKLKSLLIIFALSIAAAEAQTLQGLYLQLQPIGTSYARVHYYFWKDGRICKGLPAGGIDQEPAAFAPYQASVQKQGGECGRYNITGKQMHLQLPSLSYDASFVNFKDNSFEMNQYATAHVGFVASQKFDGTYSATVVGEQMRSQTYAFHPDGTYQLSDKPVTSRDGAPVSSSGRYRVFGSTLELNGSSGAARMTAYPFPDGGLSIAGTVFSK